MISFPCAKINLGLHIVDKRPDGFHDIQSCFYPVPWFDVLEIVPAKKFTFNYSGGNIPGDPRENLCIKAFNLINEQYEIDPVSIHLHKNIPVGAGLGGGSSNAVFCLKLLNDIFELNISTKEMKYLVAGLGSDCAFFVETKPALATGKGDQLTPLNLNLDNWYIALVYPNIPITSAEAYANIKINQHDQEISNIINQPVAAWKDLLSNDFENQILKIHPAIKKIKSVLYAKGATYASMSGSGSTVFGLFKNTPNLQNIFDGYPCKMGKL